MKAARSWLEGAAACGLVLYAPLGIGLFVLAALSSKRLGFYRAWLWVWLAPLALGVWLLLQGRPDWLLWQTVLALALASLLVINRPRAALLGLIVGVTLVVAFGLLERERSRQLWLDRVSPQTLVDRLMGANRLSGDSPGWRRNGVRSIEKTWLLEEGTTALQLSFDARLLGGEPGWQWYTNHPQLRQERMIDGEIPFTRIVHPETGRRDIVRRIRTDGPVAGRTFRATLELRAPVPVTAEECQGLLLRTLEPSFQACEGVILEADWRQFTVATTFPAEARQPAFELIINRIDAPYVDVRRVVIEEAVRETWVPLAPAEPAGAHVRLPLPDTHIFSHPTLQFIPDDEWRRHTLRIEHEAITAMRRATFVLHLEAGVDIALREIALTSLTPNTGQPVALAFPRTGLWYPNVNLAGHTLAATGLLLVLLARGHQTWLGLVGLALVLAAVFPTGSRTAWLAALIGLPWLLWWACRPAQRVWVFGVLMVMIGAAVTVLGTDALGRLQVWQADDGNSVARTEIWGAAWDSLTSQPWTGMGEEGFVEAWQARHPEDRREVPTHAHNLWLQFGAAYGVPGLLAALWLSAGLLVIAWRWGRWRGLGLVVPVLMMQVFDYTLFYAGVLFPLILGLNMLRGERPKG